ncbi:DNA topoisomerase III [Mergibacter septicus]|uniref:DNA topoisomerase n=1 Tax=Mergibacter septicus TaxID=221402 RepID=A0A8E3S7Q2_9PAST|nr:DNA topoisomerase III [Mergibacter septicus]AWX14702.1 DNA topoisomerase III [Mergibacter septicus]QDJ13953.1 DNA topoisomerase III [Mergibacter septicus]UTU48598.1 DNA topoisomerase III [Mergibacter septicus]WMR95774.1 DNA topoisomerase III [Mergibacter septicus]
MKLFLCEKPSQGRDIGKFLGANQRSDGYLFSTDKKIIVTWGIGHLLEQAEPQDYDEEYRRWSLDTLPIIPDRWKMKVKKTTSKQYKVVMALIKKADHIVIATDPDREGEVIARELLDAARYNGTIQRLWLSALDDGSIRKALSNLRADSETKSLYDAGLARARADWLVGMNLTRLFSLLAQKNGYKGVMSVGRVQSPTLGIVVQRDREIENFISKPFYVLPVVCRTNKNQSFVAYWKAHDEICDEEHRCIDLNAANTAASELLNQSIKITDVETKRVKENPPLVFDLGTLQQTCSRQFGMGAQQVLNIAQSLYETHKATTYPRTDCGYLPESMIDEIPAVLQSIVNTNPAMRNIVQQLDLSIRSRVWNDKKITAHHGIIPTTQKTDLSKMNDDEIKVYNLICRYYMAQFLPLYEEDKTTVILQKQQHNLVAKGKVVVRTGWKLLFAKHNTDDLNNSSNIDDEQSLPSLSQNDVCTIVSIDVKQLKTTPPKPFTEGTLISAMKNAARFVQNPQLKQKLRETEGLGTEATRADVIETLLKRNYLKREKRSIVSTPEGRILIDALPEIIRDPGMTALWEQALNDIAAGNMTLLDFMSKQRQFISRIVSVSAQSTIAMSNIPVAPTKICPKCGSQMRKRNSKNGEFWGCSNYPNCDAIENIKKKRNYAKKENENEIKILGEKRKINRIPI